jgi:hypothetical protein
VQHGDVLLDLMTPQLGDAGSTAVPIVSLFHRVLALRSVCLILCTLFAFFPVFFSIFLFRRQQQRAV